MEQPMIVSQLYSQDAEQAVVGSILLEGDLIKDCVLQPEHFYIIELKRIFWAMRKLDDNGKPIDIVTVTELLQKNMNKVGGVSYLSQLAESIPTTSNFKFYESTMLEHWRKRKALEIANSLKKEVLEKEPHEAIQSVISELMKIEDDDSENDDGSIKEDLAALYDELGRQTDGMTGLDTGFYELNNMTGGLQESDLIIIGARPSMGKTAFALNIGEHAAQKGEVPCIFSLEMPKKQLLKRLCSIVGNIDAQKMRNAYKDFTDDDWTKLSHAMGIINNYGLHIFDKPSMTVNYIWSKVRKVKRDNPERKILVIIDYLQLIQGHSKHRGNRLQEISEISRMLKTMARELSVPVIALSQLSRNVEQRQDKRPMMSDLRESGQIEQDADVIAFLYRDDYYNKKSELKNVTELIVAKQRNGPTGTVQLGFVKEYGKFLNLSKQEGLNFL